MNRRPGLIAFASLVLTIPSSAVPQDLGQRPGVIAPPIPDGPTLEVPKESRQPAWLEDGADVIPAGGRDAPRLLPAVGAPQSALDRVGHTAPGNGLSASSACQFDAWCQDGVFACGTASTQLLAGAYFSSKAGPDVPDFNFIPASVRFGWMLSDPEDRWFGRGNYEWLCDTTGAVITSDYGSWLAGQTYFLRYNFVEPGAVLVPYHQLGLGWLLTDAYKDQSQRAIGQMFEFQLHYQVGLKCFVAQNLSLDIEGGVQHISNANMADRNYGVNAYGGQIGLTYYFPAGGP